MNKEEKTKICPNGFHSNKDSECDCGTKGDFPSQPNSEEKIVIWSLGIYVHRNLLKHFIKKTNEIKNLGNIKKR